MRRTSEDRQRTNAVPHRMVLVQEVKTSKDLQEISHLETVEEEADRMALEDQIAEDRMLAVDQVVLHKPEMDLSQTTDSHQDSNLDLKGIDLFFVGILSC